MPRQGLSKNIAAHILVIIILLVAGTLTFSGCAGKKIAKVDMAEVLSKKAQKDFNHGDYYNAIESFQKIKDQYPFSQYSLHAELKIADCNYYIEKYDEALALYKEFEQNHPTNEKIPYVIFQAGMCSFKMMDTIDRDTSSAGEAIQAFTRLIKTYPNSPYNEEAQIRITKAKEFLARHELYVATFYKRTGELKQAEGRLEYLLDTYPDSKVAAKAGKILAEVRKQIAAQALADKGKSTSSVK